MLELPQPGNVHVVDVDGPVVGAAKALGRRAVHELDKLAVVGGAEADAPGALQVTEDLVEDDAGLVAAEVTEDGRVELGEAVERDRLLGLPVQHGPLVGLEQVGRDDGDLYSELKTVFDIRSRTHRLYRCENS